MAAPPNAMMLKQIKVMARGGPITSSKATSANFREWYPDEYKRAKAAEKSGISKHLYERYAELQQLFIQARRIGPRSHEDVVGVLATRRLQASALPCGPDTLPVYINRRGERVSSERAREKPHEIDEIRSYCEPGRVLPGYAVMAAAQIDQERENDMIVAKLA